MRVSHLRRAICVTVLDAVVLWALAELFGGFHLRDFGTALAVAALVGIANALLWPPISRAALPVIVTTRGLGVLLLAPAHVVHAGTLVRTPEARVA